MTTTTIETAGLRIYVLWGSLPGQGSRCRAPRDAWERAQVAEIDATEAAAAECDAEALGYSTPSHYMAMAWRRRADAIRSALREAAK